MNDQVSMNYCWAGEIKRIKTSLNTQVHSSKQHLGDESITLQGIAKTHTIRPVPEILVLVFFKGGWKHGENRITKNIQMLKKSFTDSDLTSSIISLSKKIKW